MSYSPPSQSIFSSATDGPAMPIADSIARSGTLVECARLDKRPSTSGWVVLNADLLPMN